MSQAGPSRVGDDLVHKSILTLEVHMRLALIVFGRLCQTLAAYNSMTASERKGSLARDSYAKTLSGAVDLIPEIIKRSQTAAALNEAMTSGSSHLVRAFPEAEYGTYQVTMRQSYLYNWASKVDADMVLALSSRGMQLKAAAPVFVRRAIGQKATGLKEWALEVLSKHPEDFSWALDLDRHALARNPDFIAALLEAAVRSAPEMASTALETAIVIRKGLNAGLLLNAGVQISQDCSPSALERLNALSNHQRLKFMRASVAAYALDRDAQRAARDIFR